MMSSAERGFHKALTALRQLQKDRDAENAAAPEQIGFVSQNAAPESTEPERKGFVSQNVPTEPAEPEHVGFVPPDCPDDVDPWEWARVHDPEIYALYQTSQSA